MFPCSIAFLLIQFFITDFQLIATSCAHLFSQEDTNNSIITPAHENAQKMNMTNNKETVEIGDSIKEKKKTRLKFIQS